MGTYWYAACFDCKEMMDLGKLLGGSLEELANLALQGNLPPLPPPWEKVMEGLNTIKAVEKFGKDHRGHDARIISEYFFDCFDGISWNSFTDVTQKYTGKVRCFD